MRTEDEGNTEDVSSLFSILISSAVRCSLLPSPLSLLLGACSPHYGRVNSRRVAGTPRPSEHSGIPPILIIVASYNAFFCAQTTSGGASVSGPLLSHMASLQFKVSYLLTYYCTVGIQSYEL